MITVQFKLLPTSEQEQQLSEISAEFISAVNHVAEYMSRQEKPVIMSSSEFNASLPSAVKNEASRNALSVVRKYNKGVCMSFPVLKKPQCIWNNQNYHILEDSIEFPVIINSKSKRISVRAAITEYQRGKLQGKFGTLRITLKNGKWIAQVAVEGRIASGAGEAVMGIDLGLKVPAVAVSTNGKTKFFGNGRQNKYVRRKFKTKRRKLGKAKKQEAIEKIDNKEQRWMKDKDHKISRSIVDFAIKSNIGIIRIEQLDGIRQTAKTSRKNEKNLHTWSFYRLSQYIEYKAQMSGIQVEYVNPAYTSKMCPKCGLLNTPKDRLYICECCGFKTHRDRLGAMNVINAPVLSGKRKAA